MSISPLFGVAFDITAPLLFVASIFFWGDSIFRWHLSKALCTTLKTVELSAFQEWVNQAFR